MLMTDLNLLINTVNLELLNVTGYMVQLQSSNFEQDDRRLLFRC